MELSDKVRNLYYNSFNVKFAVISAPINGVIAAYVNQSHGVYEMMYAGGTQAVSSFVSTGITARMVQHFSPLENRVKSYLFGSIVPATTTFALSYFGHKINDTPEALYSCIAPTAISLCTSLFTNYITRKGYMRPANYPIANSAIGNINNTNNTALRD